MANNTEFAKKAGRETAIRLAGMLATMLAYWFLIIFVVDKYFDVLPGWLLAVIFFLPAPLAFAVFYFGFQPRPFRRGMRLYDRGDYRRAAAAFTDAMHGLHVGASVKLGEMYVEGKGVPRNPDLGVEALRKAMANYYFIARLLPEHVKAGDVPRRLARAAMREQTVAKAEEWLAKAVPILEAEAGKGRVSAMNLLRDLHGLEGSRLSEAGKSVEYARMAAERDGGDNAEVALAMRLINSSSGARDDVAEGLRILEGHFRRGNLYAGWYLALQFADGDNPYLERDWKRAVAYFEEFLARDEIGGENPEKVRMYVETFNDLVHAKGKAELLSPRIRDRVAGLLERSDLP